MDEDADTIMMDHHPYTGTGNYLSNNLTNKKI